MARHKQLSFLETPSRELGGSLLKGKRKSKRTLTTKKPIHLILKGDVSQSGSLVAKRSWIDKEIERLSEKFNIKVYDHGTCRNHIHFTIKISTTENYKKFIRALSGRLAQVLKIKFLYRPYTKILEWGRHFKRAMGYVLQNKEEALGIRPYKPRLKKKLGYVNREIGISGKPKINAKTLQKLMKVPRFNQHKLWNRDVQFVTIGADHLVGSVH